MILFLLGMTAGAALLLGVFKLCCIHWERTERKSIRAKRTAQRKAARIKQIGFCGDICRNNTWMQETTSHK